MESRAGFKTQFGCDYLQNVWNCIVPNLNDTSCSRAPACRLDSRVEIRSGELAIGPKNMGVLCFAVMLCLLMCWGGPVKASDTDADGMNDQWELLYGLDPGDPDDAMMDLDQDSYSNLGEYLHHSDPGDSSDVPSNNMSILVPADARTIQAAIDGSIAGDTVVVSPGTYHESLDFKGHDIHLRSTDPENVNTVLVTIIHGTPTLPVVSFHSGESSNARLEGLTLTGGTAGVKCSSSASPRISKCHIVTNRDNGVYIQGSSVATVCIDQCRIVGNGGAGASGIVCRYSKLVLTNSIVANNGTSSSTGLYLAYASAGLSQIVNCTVTGHTSRGVYRYFTSDVPDIRNCILWNNGDELGECSATYSCIQDGDSGLGNTSMDPGFVDSAFGDYHLSVDSMCVDAGAPWSDVAHEPGPNGSRVNMGAYGGTAQATPSTDADGDGLSDNWEAFYWPGSDPHEHDPEEDPDQDGFSNETEYLYGYDPIVGTDTDFAILHAEVFPEAFNPTQDETVSIRYWSNKNATGSMDLVSSVNPNTVIHTPTLSAVAGFNETQWDGINDRALIARRGLYDVALTLDDGDGHVAVNAPFSANLVYTHKIDAIYCNPQRIQPLNNEVMTITYQTATDEDVWVNLFDSRGELFGSYPVAGSGPNELVLHGTNLPVGDPGSRYLPDEDYSIEITYQGMEETKEAIDTSAKRDESSNYHFEMIGLSGYMYSDSVYGYHYYSRYDSLWDEIITIGYYGSLPIYNPLERPTRPGLPLDLLRERIVMFHNNDPCSVALAAKEAWLDALESGRFTDLQHEWGWSEDYVPTAQECSALADTLFQEYLPNWDYEAAAGWVNNDAVSTGGDPVFLSNGEFTLGVTDLQFAGRVLPVRVVRTYGSRREYNGRFGYGWDINYNIKVRRLADPNVVVYLDGQGNKREYIRSESDPNILMRDSDLSTYLLDSHGVLTLMAKTGMACQFDPNGNLAKISDKNGNAVTLTYDSRGLLPIKGVSGAFLKEAFDGPENRYGVVAMEYQLKTITDDLGRDTTLAYDANGLLETLTDFADRCWVYTYDPKTNDLLTVTDPNGHTTTYDYGLRHNLTRITDPAGQVFTTNTYDLDDRVVSQEYGEGVFSFDYHDDVNEVIVMDREGGLKRTVLNDSGQVLSETVYTSDPDADPSEFTVTNSFNTHLNIERTALPAGNCVDYDYDALGNITAIYQKTSASDPNYASDPNVLATLFTYDPNHRYKVETVTDPEGHVTTFEYDLFGHVTAIRSPSVGQQTPIVQYTYTPDGQLDTSTSPDGIVSKYLYYSEPSDPNNDGRLWKVIADYGTDPICENITTELAYDRVGNLRRITDPNGNTSRFVYNEMDELVQTVDAEGHETVFGYRHAKLAWTRTQVNAVDQTIQYTYDLLDHVKTVTDPLGYITFFGYNKNEAPNRRTDPEGNTADRVYNERGLVCTGIDAHGGETEYAYDDNGNLIQMTDALGNVTQYTYDKFDSLIRTTYEGGTYKEWYYNRNSQVTRSINRAGQEIAYQYDALGRMTAKDYAHDPDILLAYDIAGRLTDVNDRGHAIQYTYDRLGRISSVADVSRTVSYDYNTRGLRTRLTYPGSSTLPGTSPKSKKQNKPKKEKEEKSKKDKQPGKEAPLRQNEKAGERKSLQKEKGPAKEIRPNQEKKIEKDKKSKKDKDPKKPDSHAGSQPAEAFSVVYRYDTLGRIQQIVADNNDVLAEYTYDELSRRTQLTLGNGAIAVYEYDLGNRLTKLTHHVSSSETLTFDYPEYDRVGNRLSARINADPARDYAYDNLYQLTFVDYNDGTSTTYHYDPGGNRTHVYDVGSTSYTSNALNQYTALDSISIHYDANGNLTGTGGNTFYNYDCENRLTSVYDQNGEIIASYVYDYLGRRTRKTLYGSVNVITQYAYDGDQVIAEYDGSDNLLRRFVYGPGIDEPICMIDVEHGNTVYYYHLDGLGSVIALSDVNNVIVERYFYTVFGEPSQVSEVSNPYLFTGRRFDTETRLYYYRARYYAYDIGRFLQTDPIGYADGMNWYAYCGNNPVGLVDPYGLCKGGGWWGKTLDATQGVLDVGGMWPAIGIIPDAANTLISAFRGNWTDAAFNAGAMLPILGQGSTAAKWVKKGTSHADEAVSLGMRGKVVLGENMDRVSRYARKIGAEIFEGTGMKANRSWIRRARDEGKEIIDIGPDFGRRLERKLQGARPDSPFYNMERMEAGEAVRRMFDRSGKFQGGVQGFDF